nr:hypothetical protein [Zobellia laminariae]
MIEVFTTNIPNENCAMDIIARLQNNFSELKISFDIEHKVINYPCNYSILRIEGNINNVNDFILIVKKWGFECTILEDRICKKQKAK